MRFCMDRSSLMYLAGTMAELGEVVASPRRNTITAYDMMRTRRLSYRPPGEADPYGRDVGLDALTLQKIARRVRGEASVTLAPDGLVVAADCIYKLRLLHSPGYLEEPSASHTGEAAMPAAGLREALEDARAAGATSVVVTADRGAVLLRGEGAADCCISIHGSRSTGTGYSRLDNTLLLPCVPDSGGCTLSLAPGGPTAMRFGGVTYHQGARI